MCGAPVSTVSPALHETGGQLPAGEKGDSFPGKAVGKQYCVLEYYAQKNLEKKFQFFLEIRTQ